MATILHEPEATAARHKIAATAAKMLNGSLSFIEGTREVLALSSLAKLDQFDPDILPFVGAYSETDALPLGEVRELWAPDALEKLKPEFERKERWARELCQEACSRLVKRFGTPHEH
jgi:hypothetical protein